MATRFVFFQCSVCSAMLFLALVCGCKKGDGEIAKRTFSKNGVMGDVTIENTALKGGKLVFALAEDEDIKAEAEVKMSGKFRVSDPPVGKVKIYFIPPANPDEKGQVALIPEGAVEEELTTT